MSTIAATNLKNASSGGNNIVLNTDGTIGGTCLTQTCRAWVNFNGTGTVAIRAQYNVSSITDNGVGNYTVNFTTAMADTNYAVVEGAARSATPAATDGAETLLIGTRNTGSVQVFSGFGTGAANDYNTCCVAIFR